MNVSYELKLNITTKNKCILQGMQLQVLKRQAGILYHMSTIITLMCVCVQ
jgi:hypothetical protein